MKLLWKTESGNQTSFERQFIEEVFESNRNDREEVAKLNRKKIPLVAVYSSNDRVLTRPFLEYIRGQNNLYLVHLSNESLRHNVSYYRYTKGVLRSYFDPGIKFERVFTIPLGYQTGFKRNVTVSLESKARKWIWVFVGQLKSDRFKMVNALSNLKPNFLKPTNQFGGGGSGYSVNQMIDLYEDTYFVPCPSGNINPDTFRVMECLECGCVPVVVKFYRIDYFKYIYGDHPFVVGADWENAASQIADLMSDPEKLKQKLSDVALWYESYKKDLKIDVCRIINGSSIDQLESKQFKYQNSAKKLLYVRLIFWFHFRFVFLTRIIYSKLNRLAKIFGF